MGVKRPYAWESQTTVLKPNESLVDLRADWHVRRGKEGQLKAYLCQDKRREHLICTQKLSLLADHINQLVGDDRAERITAVALYNALSNDGQGLNGGFVKHRWAVSPLSLEDAIPAFESSRPMYQTATILGSKQCVQTKAC